MPMEEWVQQLPEKRSEEVEKILEERTSKKTKNKEYEEYLVKWKGKRLVEDEWILELEFARLGKHLIQAQEPCEQELTFLCTLRV